jgi:hypothetical protein
MEYVQSEFARRIETVSWCELCGGSFGYSFRMKLRKAPLRMTMYWEHHDAD